VISTLGVWHFVIKTTRTITKSKYRKMGFWTMGVAVAKSADAVFESMRDFHSLAWAGDIPVAAVGPVAGTAVGARRSVADELLETTTRTCAQARIIEYAIDGHTGRGSGAMAVVAPPNVSNYVGRIAISPQPGAPDACVVTWTVTWVNNGGSSDDAVRGFLDAALGGALRHLASH
jgi:hypothetical protein